MKKFVLIIIVIVAVGVIYWQNQPDKAPVRPAESTKSVKVRAQQVSSLEYIQTLQLSGDAKANESVTLTSQQSERVKTIHFNEGARVKKGQTLLTLEQAAERADSVSAQAVLKDAQRHYNRVKTLSEQNALSKSELDNATSALEVARAQAAQSRVALQERNIIAPFDGILGIRDISVGALLEPGDVITTISNISPIKIDMHIAERYAGLLTTGQAFEVKALAYPNTDFTGHITVISTDIDPQSRTLTVRGEIDNETGKLKPGMLVTISLALQPQNILAIPEEALVPLAKKQYVYIVSDGQAKRKEVRIDRRFDGMVEVTKGLAKEDVVITEGQLKLTDGQAITVVSGK